MYSMWHEIWFQPQISLYHPYLGIVNAFAMLTLEKANTIVHPGIRQRYSESSTETHNLPRSLLEDLG
jgi:hypothetical protein